MLSVDEVWALIDRQVGPLPPVRMPLGESLRRCLAKEILADADMPAFCRSAIDGYEVAEGSGPGWFRIIGETRPGMPPSRAPGAGEAVRIFTGSALAESGIGLVMVEDTVGEADMVLIRAVATCRHVRARGSQAKRGDLVVPAGAVVNPGTVALLASVGAMEPLVSAEVRAAHLVTGSELVPSDSDPPPGFIRDSNTPLVAALLAEAGANRCFHRHVSESVEDAVAALRNVNADLLLISGGASVGAYDGTMEILRRLGFAIHCSKVKSRPGKPLIFATRGACAAFGLPGNPLSHFVCFHLFVRRAIDAMSNRASQRTIHVRIEGELPLPDPRETWWPAKVRADGAQLEAEAIPWKDSSDLTALAPANALLRIGTGAANGLVGALLFGSLWE
ncbi:MAG TPA: molybdopterin molybdotransferase MoeA [Terrimicrobiaceae bacterium]